MKKIVAIVLSLVMVLGLATTAFGAVKVPQWITNAVDGFDVFDGNNVKVAEGVKLSYNPAEKPSVKNEFYGNVTFYSVDTAFTTTEAEPASYDEDSFFVLVSKYEDGCIAVKASDATIEVGTSYDDILSQSVPGAVYFLKPVAAVHYNWDAEIFTAWGTKCGDIAKPADFNKKADYAEVAVFDADEEEFFDLIAELADIKDVDDAAAEDYANVIIDGVIYTMTDNAYLPAELKVGHTWVASEYAEKDGAVTKYTCANCKVVGTAVTSPFLAPQDAEIEQLGNNSYVYYYATATGTVAGDKVESAQTFDAGIAMYVGMSVMAAAGSAVVLKKKD